MTYFAKWPAWAARLVLAGMVALIILGAALKPVPRFALLEPPHVSDEMLYRDISQRVMRGEDYYAAAADEMRARWYPTGPAVVFREPTLAWLMAALRTDTIRNIALIALSFAVFIALRDALARTAIAARQRYIALPLIATGIGIAWLPGTAYNMHEIWTGFLIALSLALYRPGRWYLSVALGVAACLIRELALPFLAAMAAFALYERRYRELAGWIAGIVVFGAFFAWHLSVAGTLYRPGDPVSDGWLYGGGWPFVLETAKRNLVLAFAPNGVAAAVVCLALIGLAGTRDPWVSRTALIVGGYMAAFLIVGRPGNTYWGQLYAPLLPVGLALSPEALRDLLVSACGSWPLPAIIRTPLATRMGRKTG